MLYYYCNSTWSSTYVSNLNTIYYLEKRAVRAITNSEYRAHTAPLFSKLEILDIFQGNKLDTAKFMFCYHNNVLPPLFRNLFMTNSEVYRNDTRTASNYRVHSCRTNIKKFTILYQFGSMQVLEEAVTSWFHCSATNTQKWEKIIARNEGAIFKACSRSPRSISGTPELAVPTKKPSPCFLNVKGSFLPHFGS